MLSGKNILLGISGSIAAYKAAFIVREFIKAGANVKVVMTPAAKEFITPLTLSTLSKNPVLTGFTSEEEGSWNNHVELGLWADLMLIAPASANTLAKMANGICDNLLIATYLSAKCPVFFAPAMDLDMYAHKSTRDNIAKLQSYGNILIKPNNGELASGLYGEGRMAEPIEIKDIIFNYLNNNLPLSGKKILVSAGPTYEAIDPVRFIANHSSGKMGYAIAREAAREGAEVILISGPSNLNTLSGNITKKEVMSAEEMYNACIENFSSVDVAILSAAVADYKPIKAADQKIKKKEGNLVVELEPTVDILAALGRLKSKKQILIGFALETENEVENAKTKIKKKNLDFIVLNSLNDKGAGFKGDTNKITIIDKYNNLTGFELKSKQEVAEDIIKKVISLI